jgi:putative tryptophan/tyrosine transport system substrate-binding protein
VERRAVLALLCSVMAWPAGAQPGTKLYRIGLLWDGPTIFPDAITALREGLRGLGYEEGRNLIIEYRWGEGKPDRMAEMAEELVRLKVDLIVAPSSIYTAAAKRATSTIPIIFMSHADPLGSGHVESLALPGGNATGFSLMMTETNVKSLELLKETIPGVTRVAVIWDPATPSHHPGLKAVEAAGPLLGLQIKPIAVGAAAEFDAAFAGAAQDGAGAVLVLSTPLYITGARRLAELALEYKLPSVFGPKQHVVAGGLMSYSPDRADQWRRGAWYVDRVLRGVKPSELPVQQPVKFELVINLKTAEAIGLTIPSSMLARATEVIDMPSR